MITFVFLQIHGGYVETWREQKINGFGEEEREQLLCCTTREGWPWPGAVWWKRLEK